MKVGHLTWNLQLSKLICILMWDTTQWWRTVSKIMGSQPADILHDRAEKGGGQMTQRATDGAGTTTWLFPEHSVLVYDVCKLKPHERCHVLHLALAEAFIHTLNCFSTEQHPTGMIMLNTNSLTRWRGLLSLPPSLASYLSIEPIKYVPNDLQGFFCLLCASHPHPKRLILIVQCDVLSAVFHGR